MPRPILCATAPSLSILTALLVASSIAPHEATARWNQQVGTQQAQDEQLSAEVRALVRDIRDGSTAEADAAEAKLINLGPKVLALLPIPTDQMSANVKQRLARVREQLQKLHAESISIPTTVTLKGTMKLSEALTKIKEQTENNVFFYQDENVGETEIEFTFEGRKFMEVMDDIMDRRQLTTYGFAPEPGMALMARAASEAPRSERISTYPGPFRVEATEVMAQRSLRNAEDRRTEVTLDLSWEPRLRPIVVEMDYSKISVKDQNGNPMEITGTGRPAVEVGEDTSTEFFLPLALPDRSVTTIAELSGSFEVLIPGRTESFEFENLESGERKEQRSSGVSVVLDRVRKNADVWEIVVLLRFEKAEGALQSHRNWVYNNPIVLVSPTGEELDFDGAEIVRRTEEEVGMGYYFDLPDGPAGYKLVYKTPTMILSLPVNFTLKGIPLP
ncbi:MAG: hypothetical protein MPJ50_14510 [Pirellulales bacterium]|nr:hypothetical protein [Pirellulales bacterium]